MPFSVHNNILTVCLKSAIITMTEIRVIFPFGNHSAFVSDNQTMYLN